MNREIPNIRIYENPEALATAAAEEFFRRAFQARANRQLFSCALSGGSTPAQLFAHMSAEDSLTHLPARFWDSIHFFWCDERNVPLSHPDSNYRLAKETLFDKIDIPRENLHPIQTELTSAAAAANAYENELKQFFALQPGAFPDLDLIFLGMGDDGHTASLFPHSESLKEKERLVAAPWVAKLETYRITLTLPVINNAACILFLIQGSGKAEILKRVLTSPLQPDLLPAQAIQPVAGELLWLADQAAAAELAGITTVE
jgi:6-phosphogluconolactonase